MCSGVFSQKNKNITDFLHSLWFDKADMDFTMMLTFYIKVRCDVMVEKVVQLTAYQ